MGSGNPVQLRLAQGDETTLAAAGGWPRPCHDGCEEGTEEVKKATGMP